MNFTMSNKKPILFYLGLILSVCPWWVWSTSVGQSFSLPKLLAISTSLAFLLPWFLAAWWPMPLDFRGICTHVLFLYYEWDCCDLFQCSSSGVPSDMAGFCLVFWLLQYGSRLSHLFCLAVFADKHTDYDHHCSNDFLLSSYGLVGLPRRCWTYKIREKVYTR